MTLPSLAAPRPDSAESFRFSVRSAWPLLLKTLAIVLLDLRKLRRDPTELFIRTIQPALWLLVFGEVFSHDRAIPTGGLPYLDFMAPGILGQSVLFIAIFNGISVIWERDLGIIQRLLVSPTPRAALVLGKGLAAGCRALSQAFVIYFLAWLLGVNLDWRPHAVAGVLGAVVLGAALFSTFSLIIASLVKTRERFMGIGQVLTMPLFFASDAIYPLAMMPAWLRAIAWVNPLTYEVDALRALMLVEGVSEFGLALDFLVMLGTTGILTAVGAWCYPRLGR